jgi:transcriptional regulator with XRE-family HTH domain
VQTIGKRIKTLREQRGMTQHELARFSGITFATLNRLENDKANVTVKTADSILGVFGYELAPKNKERDSGDIFSGDMNNKGFE